MVVSPPEASTAAGAKAHRLDIQGLRAVAVLLVVLYHARYPPAGGFVGVDVFFVISGFVISRMIFTRLQRDGRLGLAEFYTRRIRRLLPALAVTTSLVMVLGLALLSPLSPQRNTAGTGLGATFLGANAELFRTSRGGYFDIPAETNALLHTWSLSVEEQFYLLFPLSIVLLWGVAHRRAVRPRRLLAIFLGLLAAGSFALAFVTSFGHLESVFDGLGGDPSRFAFYSPFTRAWEFGAGVLLALAEPLIMRGRRLTRAVMVGNGLLLSLVGLAGIAYAATQATATTKFPGWMAIFPVCGTAAVIAGGTMGANLVSRVLSWRPLVWIGDVSYGWYLWHWPMIVFARGLWPSSRPVLLGAVVVALGVAALSYRTLEARVRFNEAIRGRRVVALVAICVAVPVLAAGLLVAGQRVERDDRRFVSLAAAAVLHGDAVLGCDSTRMLSERDLRECITKVPEGVGTAYLIGDSNAGQFTEVAKSAAASLRLDLVVATQSGCPFVDLRIDVVHQEECTAFVRDAVRTLVKRRPRLVMIASSSSEYVDGDFHLGDAAPGAPIAKRAKIWGDGVAKVVGRLDEAGIPTLVVHTVPHIAEKTAWLPQLCPPVWAYTDVGRCDRSVSRASIERQQAPARDIERVVVSGMRRASSVDFTGDICALDRCAARRGDVWLYHDGTHLSIAGARLLEQPMTKAMGRALGAT
jgi:peptidoglycan/LPS O-acetylase OafA/YrhL